MLNPGEAHLVPAPRIDPKPVDNEEKGGADGSIVYVKGENL